MATEDGHENVGRVHSNPVQCSAVVLDDDDDDEHEGVWLGLPLPSSLPSSPWLEVDHYCTFILL